MLEAGDEVLNVRTNKKEKVARLFRIHANKRERLDKAVAGEIVAAAGLKDATTGDTVCDPKAPILLERIDTYEPVISQAIEAENAVGQGAPRLRARQDGRGGPDLPGQGGPRDRPDHHLAAWASSTSRSSSTA